MSQPVDNPEPDVLTSAQRRRGLVFLWLTCASVGVVMALQMGLNANYVREEMGLAADQQGILFAQPGPRASPADCSSRWD